MTQPKVTIMVPATILVRVCEACGHRAIARKVAPKHPARCGACQRLAVVTRSESIQKVAKEQAKEKP